jgi:hypothetical protein
MSIRRRRFTPLSSHYPSGISAGRTWTETAAALLSVCLSSIGVADVASADVGVVFISVD